MLGRSVAWLSCRHWSRCLRAVKRQCWWPKGCCPGVLAGGSALCMCIGGSSVPLAWREERAIADGLERPDTSSYLHSTFCVQRTFTYTLAFNPHKSTVESHVATSPFCLGGNSSSEKPGNLPTVTAKRWQSWNSSQVLLIPEYLLLRHITHAASWQRWMAGPGRWLWSLGRTCTGR